MPTGRPTLWKDSFLQTTRDYIEKYAVLGDVVPTIEGLACELHCGVRSITNFREAHPEFDDLVCELLAKQGRQLQNKGLSKETDSGITKLLLSANHAKSEKVEQDITSKGEKVSGFVVEFVENAKKAPVSPEA